VLEKSEEELLALRNFGRKSYDELRDKLDEMGILGRDGGEEELYDAPPLEDDEAPAMIRQVAEPEAELEPELVSEPPEVPGIEPAPVGRRKSRARDKAPPEPTAEGDEDIEDWKRKLLELTEAEEEQ
jgi:hypothetical protein